jgi:hypothetical protein
MAHNVKGLHWSQRQQLGDLGKLLQKYAKMMVGFKGLQVVDGKEMLLKF